MAKRKNRKDRQSKPGGDQELNALYAKMRRKFTAADLQKYTEIEDGIPLEQVIAEMKEIHRKFKPKKA